MKTTANKMKTAENKMRTAANKLKGESDIRRLTLEEIIALPKASVIWREEHDKDHETGCYYYEVEPMLVCVPGEEGVLAWADHDSELMLDINDDLIKENRFFWNNEPTKEQITEGIPVVELNRFFEENDVREIKNLKLLALITRYRYSVPAFCHVSGIPESHFMDILKGNSVKDSDLSKICKILGMNLDELNGYITA